MCVCPEYVLLHILTSHDGCAGDFTAALVAELAWVAPTTAQKWIDKTLRWRLISKLTANFEGIEGDNPIPSKNAVNSKRGPKAVHYCLTPHLAEDMVRRALPDHVQELMEAPEPGVIYAEEALSAGVDDAAALESISAAAAQTLDAFEVSAKAERAAVQKAREIERLAASDETPFATDELPCSVRGLRTMLIETLIATEPDRVWKHAELMWVAGAKRHSVGALIAKSRKIMPAPTPTFVKVTLDGQHPHAAMQAQCRKHHGAPVAWLDSKGEVISGFGRSVPAGTKGGLINVGKVYIRREQPPELPTERAEKPTQEPTEEAKRKASQARARSAILPRLRGCLLARGWRFTPGPYGYCERDGQATDNSFEGIVQALLTDRDWAQTQHEQRQRTERMHEFAASVSAEVKEFA